MCHICKNTHLHFQMRSEAEDMYPCMFLKRGNVCIRHVENKQVHGCSESAAKLLML